LIDFCNDFIKKACRKNTNCKKKHLEFESFEQNYRKALLDKRQNCVECHGYGCKLLTSRERNSAGLCWYMFKKNCCHKNNCKFLHTCPNHIETLQLITSTQDSFNENFEKMMDKLKKHCASCESETTKVQLEAGAAEYISNRAKKTERRTSDARLEISPQQEPTKPTVSTRGAKKPVIWKKNIVCRFFRTLSGCHKGDFCPYIHNETRTTDLRSNLRSSNRRQTKEVIVRSIGEFSVDGSSERTVPGKLCVDTKFNRQLRDTQVEVTRQKSTLNRHLEVDEKFYKVNFQDGEAKLFVKINNTSLQPKQVHDDEAIGVAKFFVRNYE